ncbi:hypothetical protein [uncultured Parabacteroides sp.]|uniref:hypothetical protein n=1 Tax=uncultured Parabacteroides sp. TaxID=512312 RepID=UPI002591412F|nr:hypothetical protein [uncultured Parabacteroides sp.]
MKTFYKLCSMLLCSAFLLGGCTKETQTDGGDPRPGDDSIAEVREVMMTLKSQLVLQKGATKANATDATTTKAETSIATAAENAISTLDVYVFGAESENGDYTFLERFAYRADSNDKLPKDAKELQPNTTGADGKETTALMKLKKGLFVKLYCIANDTTLVDPTTDKEVKPKDLTLITFTENEDGTPQLATEGKPLESTFVTWHTRLLTATAKADTLVTPLAMAGAYTTPIDLTSFDNSARIQVGFKLTRLTARFDIDNKAGDSRFTIETVSMGNGRRGSGFFPIRVYGDLPEAKPDQLITYPVHAFYGDNANNGLCTGAFYAYPSPRQDKAFLILNGKYKVNETEMKNVSYQIPFTQPTADGNTAWLDIANNHRYTIAVTNKIRGGANITFTVQPTMGTPTLKKTAASISGSLPTGSNIALANNTRLTLYKTDAANSTMTISATCYGGSKAVISGTGLSVSPNNTLTTNTTQNYTVTSTANSGTGTLTIYNSDNTKTVALPITMADGEIRINGAANNNASISLYPKGGQTSTVKVKSATGISSWSVSSWGSGGRSGWFSLPGTPAAGEPTVTLTAVNQAATQKASIVTLKNKISGCPDRTFTVTPNFKAPEAASTSMTLTAGQNNSVPYIDITGVCPGGSTITGPAWITFGNTTSTTGSTYSYRIQLNPAKSGFPTYIPGNQTFTITNAQNNNLQTTVTVNITEANAWIAKDLSGYDNAGEKRIGTGGKTGMTVEVYSMFVTPTFNNNYNGTYCNSTNEGNSWLTASISTTVVNNRRKYTFTVRAHATSGTDAAYQWHEANPQIKYGNTVVKQYKIIRGASIYPYPAGGGSPYYSSVLQGGRWWAPVNIGATYIGTQNDYTSTTSTGYFFQWGRKNGIDINNYNYISSGAPVSRSVGDKFNDFYKCNWGTYDWQTPQNDYSWLLGSSSNPCPAGYYVPTESEWKALSDRSRSSANGRVTLPGDNGLNLIIPQAGYRNCDNQFGGRNSIANYFTSTADPNGNGCYKFTSYSNKWVVDITSRGNAYPLRCIKEQ